MNATPSAPAAASPAPRSWRFTVGTIALGLGLIAVLTPLTQFLTLMTVNADIETATPNGWAVGLVISLVLANAAFFTLARRRLVARERLVLLYAMLTIAVPLMNLGLLRPFFLTSVAVMREYLLEGSSTYRTTYDALNPDWLPVAPSAGALAWHRADRLLRLLDDPALARSRAAAHRTLAASLAPGSPPLAPATATALLAELGPDEALRLDEALAALPPGETPDWAGLLPPVRERLLTASTAAAARLPAALGDSDERTLSWLPEVKATLDPSARHRLTQEQSRLDAAERAAREAAVADLAPRAPDLRALVSALTAADRARVRADLAAAKAASQAVLPRDELDALRHSFVYRLNREERLALIRPTAGGEAPTENVYAITTGLLSPGYAPADASWWRLARQVAGDIPWHLWIGPLLRWGLLFLIFFLLLMVVAEWLRRKWVEQENLAFPLVEMIDGAIRHDARLEVADDPRDPAPRRRLFYPPWVWGFAVGGALLSVEALGHHGFLDHSFGLHLDLSREVFANGPLREMSRVTLAVSPIIVGLLFLVSLEVSFSIWISFVLYTAIVWIFQVSLTEIPRDELYTGWGGGRFFPFNMEQLLGAAVAFALVIAWKTWRGGRPPPGDRPAPPAPPAATYVPPRLLRIGIIVLPLLALVLLWDYGITHPGLLLVAGVVVAGVTLTTARVRAETGLPAQHATYEFAKLPLVFGLSASAGGAGYTRFIGMAFLPLTLLWRTLPQQLENLELARRHRVSYRTVAVATLVAFVAAVGLGMVSYLIFNYAFGDRFTGGMLYPGQGNISNQQLAHYPFWVAHFLGEAGLDRAEPVHPVRLLFMGIGAGVVFTLVWLRRRFLRFPLHPVGYLVMLLSLYFYYISFYPKGTAAGGSLEEASERSLVWGSALVAWGVKSLLVKYGGMTLYKRAKPFFTGLIVGAVTAIFVWNSLHLAVTLTHDGGVAEAGWFAKRFLDTAPYSPRFY
jgi:hypothetical protein